MSVQNDYRRWERRRAAIARLEEMGGQVRSSEWERSDDAATGIMHDAMSVLGNVTATLTTISEALCMASWTCSEAESVYQVMTDLGLDELADDFMLAHAHTDSADEDDMHRYVEDPDNHVNDRWERVEIDE